jgi:hypothetical protein
MLKINRKEKEQFENARELLEKELELYRREIQLSINKRTPLEQFEKEKLLLDKEIELYRKEKQFEIDSDLLTRINSNRKELDIVRIETYEKIAEVKSELSKLESDKDHLTEFIESKKEGLKEFIEVSKSLIAQKDNEIKRLNDIITSLISKENSINFINCNSPKAKEK